MVKHLDEERVPETGFMFLHEAQEALFELTNVCAASPLIQTSSTDILC